MTPCDADDQPVPTPASAAAPTRRRPGRRVRLYVAVGDRPPRWYRNAAEAVDDARHLEPPTPLRAVAARAWLDEDASGPPAWELRRIPRRGLVWQRPDPPPPAPSDG